MPEDPIVNPKIGDPIVNEGGTLPDIARTISNPFQSSQERLQSFTADPSNPLKSLSDYLTNIPSISGGGYNQLPVSEIGSKENQRYSSILPGANNEELYHEQQSGWDRFWNAGANLVGKTLAYTVQTAGFLLGSPFAAITGNISNMTDNFITHMGDDLKDYVSDEFPIYKGDRYTKGN